MFKQNVTEYTVQQRGGKDPDVQITRTEYIPISRSEVAKNLLKSYRRKHKLKTDYGITETQFEDILDKASKPTIKNRKENE